MAISHTELQVPTESVSARGISRRNSLRVGPGALAAASSLVMMAALLAPAPAEPGSASAMDQPIALLEQTRAVLGRVADYECTLIKHERVRGKLLAEQAMTMRARRQPYSVYLHFQSPDSVRGQEVCFVEGRNKGLMRVHPAGWRGIVGFVSLDVRDPRAFADNRHPITEATLWTLVESTARYWQTERRVNKTRVRMEDRVFQGRSCYWIETMHPERSAAAYYARRCVLCIDKETKLPVRMEAYDWPRANAPAEGDLLECYSYLDTRCNQGLTDRAFDY
jgi:hypothetical protein